VHQLEKNTPALLVQQIKALFGSSSRNISWASRYIQTKFRKACDDPNVEVFIGVKHYFGNKEPSNIQSPCDLPIGFYNWVLTADHQLTFGLVTNNLEFGVTSRELADCREVYAAGQLRIKAGGAENKFGDYNLLAGSYSPIYTEDVTYYPMLLTRLKILFEIAEELCPDNSKVKFNHKDDTKDLCPPPRINLAQAQAICKIPFVIEHPSNIFWAETGSSICGNFEIFF